MGTLIKINAKSDHPNRVLREAQTKLPEALDRAASCKGPYPAQSEELNIDITVDIREASRPSVAEFVGPIK
jgi:hypothetical protein